MKRKLLLGANFVIGVGILSYILYRHGGSAFALLTKGFSVGFLFAFLGAATVTLLCLSWRWRS